MENITLSCEKAGKKLLFCFLLYNFVLQLCIECNLLGYKNHCCDNIAEGIHIRSRCYLYEEGEKSSKFFLNLEKFNGMQSQVLEIIVNDQEITDPNKILHEIRHFYEPPSQINNFLDKVQLPKLNI